jgi:hypothetical protein
MILSPGFCGQSRAGGGTVDSGDLRWEGQRHFGAATWAAGDVEESSIAVENLKALANIFHSDTVAGALENTAGMGAAGGDADPVVFHFNDEFAVFEAAAQRDDAAGDARLEPMLDTVFDQRLEQHAGHRNFQGSRIDFPGNGQFFSAEASDLDGKVIIGGGELITELHEGIVLIEHFAQNIGEFNDELAGLLGAKADKRGNRVEGVEEEVWIDLTLKGVKARFEEETLLFFEGSLDADGVPDFERDADDHGGAGPDGDTDDPAAGGERKEAMGHASDQLTENLHSDDEDQKQNLAIDAGTQQRAANPAVEAEVDEGGEGPDFFLIDEAAVDTGGDGDGEQEGKRKEFAMEDGGKGKDGGSHERSAWADEDADDDGGLKGDVGGVEVGDGDTNQYAEAEGNTDEGEKPEGLGDGTVFTEQKVLKFARASEGRGDGCGYTQLNEQGYEDEARVEHSD